MPTDRPYSLCEARKLRSGKLVGKPCVLGSLHDGDHEDENGTTWKRGPYHKLGHVTEEEKVPEQNILTSFPCCKSSTFCGRFLPYDEDEKPCGKCGKIYNITLVPGKGGLAAEFELANVPLEFFCDSAGCEATIPTGKKSILEAREVAKKRGWVHEADKDFCPDHREAW